MQIFEYKESYDVATNSKRVLSSELIYVKDSKPFEVDGLNRLE